MNHIHEIKSNQEIYFHKYFMKRVKSKNSYLTNICASHGKIEYLIYARREGCLCNTFTCECAAMYGHIECLQYLHDNSCRWCEYTCYYAAQFGYLDCLRYALVNGCPYDKSKCIQESTDRKAIRALFEELGL
jgi:hypothetical protein